MSAACAMARHIRGRQLSGTEAVEATSRVAMNHEPSYATPGNMVLGCALER